MVREAPGGALPTKRKRPERAGPKLRAVREFIDTIPESDRKAARKQRHTAHRIYQRLRVELPGGDASGSTVRSRCAGWEGGSVRWD